MTNSSRYRRQGHRPSTTRQVFGFGAQTLRQLLQASPDRREAETARHLSTNKTRDEADCVLARLTQVARVKRRIKFVECKLVAFSGAAVNSRLRSPSISCHSVDLPPARSLIDFERASSTLEHHACKRRARAKFDQAFKLVTEGQYFFLRELRTFVIVYNAKRSPTTSLEKARVS